MARDRGYEGGRVIRRIAAGVDGAGALAGDGGAVVWGIGELRSGITSRPLFGTGLASSAWGSGAGAELGDVLRRAALPGLGAGECVEAEVAADFFDDVRDGAAADVVVEVGGVQALAQLRGEGLGVVAVGVAVVVGLAPDDVLDIAEDALAGGCAVPGRVLGGRDGFGEAVREGDAAADAAADAVEGCGGGGKGAWDGGVCRGARRGLWCGVPLRGLGLRRCMRVQEAGEVGAHVDEVVQNLAVGVRVCGLLAWVVLVGGLGCLGRHERKKNIHAVTVSRLAWVGWCRVGIGWAGGRRRVEVSWRRA